MARRNAPSPRLMLLLPFGISFALHAGTALVALFILFAYGQHAARDTTPLIIPSSFEEPALSQNPGTGAMADPTRDARDRLRDRAQSEGWDQAGAFQGVSKMAGTGAPGSDPMAGFSGTSAMSPGQGNGSALGLPSGGAGGGEGPRSTFAGLGGNATKIVYLIDCTGSLVDFYGKYGEIAPGTVKATVRDSVDKLVPLQFFAVDVFTGPADGGTMPLGTGVLARATPENKDRTLAALRDTVAKGGDTDEETSFIAAFRTAFQQKPDLIFFFTDGNLSDNVLREVRQLNKDKSVHISAVMFNYTDRLDPADKERFDRLAQLAKENGGNARLVTAKILVE